MMDAKEILKDQHAAEAAYIRERMAAPGPLWTRERPRLARRCRALIEEYLAAGGEAEDSPLNGLAAELEGSPQRAESPTVRPERLGRGRR